MLLSKNGFNCHPFISVFCLRCRGITQFGNNLAIPTHGDPIFRKHKKSAHWFEKFSLDCLDFQANNVEK